jgi:hypothetical protein
MYLMPSDFLIDILKENPAGPDLAVKEIALLDFLVKQVETNTET